MIYGNVNNEFFGQQVAILPKPLGDALRFLKTADLANHEAGRFPMNLNGVDVILQVMDLETKPRETAKPASTSTCSSWSAAAPRKRLTTTTTAAAS